MKTKVDRVILFIIKFYMVVHLFNAVQYYIEGKYGEMVTTLMIGCFNIGILTYYNSRWVGKENEKTERN